MTSDHAGLGGLGALAAARLWAAARFPYLASGLFGAQVTAMPGLGSVAIDPRWRLYADPDLLTGWTPAELGSVLVHHVCHLLREHPQRAEASGVTTEDSAEWIRAADAEINDDLIPAGLELPADPVQPKDFGAEPGKLAEEYYALLKRQLLRPGAGPGPGRWLDCGSGADGLPRAGEEPGGLDPWLADLLLRQVAQEIIRHSESIGTVPAGLLRWAQELLAPTVDWRRLLAAELRRAIADVTGAVDYSYRRPSRRAAAVSGVVLPALRRPVPELAVVCDTSGSMSDELLAMALAEVEGLLRALGMARRLRVLACDAAAGPAQRVSSARQVELTGGGGTDMGAGIAAAYALRPRPALTVVLTDGHTPWPRVPPKGMRVVAGLLGDRAPDAPGWARSVRVPRSA
ncbi:VWA-like domain-containing protein [Trebonia sp.]|uniref:vWA domain-containing protein n=1 Tax=Trebonia sp. TaxID=2767075 RepID=UPI00261A8338|nr:VWA-like domain-containing protein [Trebonia sp.]